jgi:hypothetical protein
MLEGMHCVFRKQTVCVSLCVSVCVYVCVCVCVCVCESEGMEGEGCCGVANEKTKLTLVGLLILFSSLRCKKTVAARELKTHANPWYLHSRLRDMTDTYHLYG